MIRAEKDRDANGYPIIDEYGYDPDQPSTSRDLYRNLMDVKHLVERVNRALLNGEMPVTTITKKIKKKTLTE